MMWDNVFLNIGITFATLSLSGNCTVFNTLFINYVKSLTISGSISFNNLLDIP